MNDGQHWAENAPFAWYAHGDVVLDALRGSRSAQDIHVVAVGPMPTAETVRVALRVEPLVTVLIEDIPHRRSFTIDDIVLTPEGTLVDIQRETEATAEWPLAVTATRWDLKLSDLLRLATTLDAYPELKTETTLRRLATSALTYARSSEQAFPEVTGLLESLTPYTRWREPTPGFPEEFPAAPQS